MKVPQRPTVLSLVFAVVALAVVIVSPFAEAALIGSMSVDLFLAIKVGRAVLLGLLSIAAVVCGLIAIGRKRGGPLAGIGVGVGIALLVEIIMGLLHYQVYEWVRLVFELLQPNDLLRF